jgi:tRNA modification GTPase
MRLIRLSVLVLSAPGLRLKSRCDFASAGCQPWPDPCRRKYRRRFPDGVPVIRVWNKIDLSGHHASVDSWMMQRIFICPPLSISASICCARLLRIAGWQQTGESLYMARERHLIALKQAHEHLQNAAEYAAQNDQSLDLFAEELRLTQDRLNSITGEFTPDDLLGVIFSRFCIGK